MKLALILLSIATICLSIPILTPYRSIDISGANKDPVLTSLLEFGAKQLIQTGIQENKIPHPDFRLSKVNSIHMQHSNGLNYKFDVDLQDKDGLTVNSAFVMNYQPQTDEKKLSALTYSLRKAHLRPEASKYVTIENPDLQHNPHLAEILEFGVQDLIQRGISDQKIPLKQFRLGKLLKVQKQDVGLGSGSYYHFNLDLTDGEGIEIMSTMTLFHNPYTREHEVIDSNYKVMPFVSHLQLSSHALDDPNAYITIDSSSVSSNPEAQAALQYGVSQVINAGISEKKLAITQLTVSQIGSCQKQTTGSGVNYKFQLSLGDSTGATSVSTTFTVFINKADQVKSMLSYNYSVQTTTTTTKTIDPNNDNWTTMSSLDITNDANVQTCQTYGNGEVLRQALTEGKITSDDYTTTKLTSVEKQTVDKYSFYRFNLDMTNKAGNSVLTAVYTIIYNLDTSKPGMKSFLYKVVTKTTTSNTVTTTDADGYSQVDLIDVQSNAEVKSCLEFGVAQVIQKGLTDQKIPIAQYSLSNVNSAGKLLVGELTNYKFDVSLSSGQGTILSASFTTQLNTKTVTKTLLSLNYSAKTVTTTKVTIEPDETAYVDVAISEATVNTQISGNLDFCQSEVLKNALATGKITTTTGFKVITITKIQKQKVGSYLFTKLELNLGDTLTTTININAVVALNTDTNERQLRTYTYNVKVTKVTKTSYKEPADTDYTTVPPDNVVNSVEIQAVMDYASQQVLAGALKEGKIKNTDFSVDKASVRGANVTGATFYKFTVTMNNGKDTVLDYTATILHESSGRDSVRAYNYNIKVTSSIRTVITDPNDSDYIVIDQSEVSTNAQIQSGLQFALQQTLNDAQTNGKIKNTDGYNIDQITYSGRAVVKKVTFYKFVLTISNDEDTTVQTTVVILWDTKSSAFVLRKLNYNVTVIQNVASTIQEPSDSDYETLSDDEVQTSLVQSILGVGTQQIIQAALTEGKIKDGSFSVSNVQSVMKASVKVFTFYRFSVVISNGDDTTITATFTCVHNTRSGDNNLRRYNYNVKIITWTVSNIAEPDDSQYVSFDSSQLSVDSINSVFQYSIDNILSAGIQAGKISSKDFTATVITYCGKVTVKQFTFYKFTYTLDNDDDTTIDVTCTLAVDGNTGEIGLRKYTYNVTITQTLITDVKEPDDGDYRDLDTAIVKTDTTVSGALSDGVTEILNKALSDGKITSTNFNVNTITSVGTATVKKYVFYRFSIILDNDDDTTITCTYTVVHSVKTEENSLRRYNYNVVITQTLITDITEPGDSDYSDLELSDVDSDEQVHEIYEYGISQVLQNALNDGKISNANFNVKNVISVRVATVKKFLFYRFSLVLDDGDETTIDCTSTVVHSSKTGENSLRRYNYKVTVIHVYVSDAPEPSDDEYSDVSLDEVQGNAVVNGGLTYSASEIVKTALSDGKISGTNFNIKQVISCSRAVSKRFTFYRYNFILDNGDDTTIEVSVTTVHDSKNDQYGVRRFTYNVHVTITLINDVQEPSDSEYVEFDNSEVQTNADVTETFQFGATGVIAHALEEGRISSSNFNVQTINYCKRVTIKSFTFYRYSFTLNDGEDTSIDCTITVVHSAKTSEDSLRRYLYTVTVTQTLITDITEPSDSEYSDVEVDVAESDTVIKTAYSWGCDELLQKAISEGKVTSDSGLIISSIVSVKKAVVKRWVFYRFEVVLDNGNGATMTASLTVIQDSKSGEFCLRRYVYQVTIKTVTTHTSTTETDTTSETISKTITKYTTVSVDDVTKSVQLMSIVDSGVRWICERLYKDGIIKDISFKITTIDSCYQKYENNLYYYKFTVHISHSSGLTLEITFTCSYNSNSQITTVISFSIIGSTQEVGKVVCIDSPDFKEVASQLIIGNLESVDTTEVEGCSEIRDAMLYGVGVVGAQCAKQENLADADFSVANVNSIYRQFLAGVSYRFNVDLENTSGEKVKATFTISADHSMSQFYYVAYE